MKTKIGEVYLTDELSSFKSLIGNREVKSVRKKNLTKSIDENGYIPSPIIVNEKMEVIDGQGRLEACKELETPIAYFSIPGIGISECMVLNVNMKNWSLLDYIKSYAEQGSPDYQRIYKIAQMRYNHRTYMFAISMAEGIASGFGDLPIKEGRSKCSSKAYEEAKVALDFLSLVKPYTDQVQGRHSDLESAVIFAFKSANCNNDRLIASLSRNYGTIVTIGSLGHALDELSRIYNHGLKQLPRIYLKEEYDRFSRRSDT